MQQTTFKNSKRTKIIATIGPATNSFEAVTDLIKAGVNGFRFNFSHADYEVVTQQLEWIRTASKDLGKPVAAIQDLQGPKIRLGDFEGAIELQEGAEVEIRYDLSDGADAGAQSLPARFDLSSKVRVGERLYMYDGSIRSEVIAVNEGSVRVRLNNGGKIMKKKGLNLPDTDFAGDVITPKDREDIVFGATQDFDFVAQSFVQHADDIDNLRALLKEAGSDARVIAKIETKAAIENLESIIESTDGVMVARGDLAVETPPESVPIEQRRIIGLAIKHNKVSIVATQMLQSMTEKPEPTRAEVSDVATATIVGADSVMLSDETAMGKYPIETVQMMKRIILYTQENAPLKPVFYQPDNNSTADAISSAIITLAHQVEATAIVAETSSGATARNIASHRPAMPIVMVTDSARVQQQLSIVYGGKSYMRPAESGAAEKLTDWLKVENILNEGDTIVSASGQYPGVSGGTDTIKVRRL